MAEQSSAAHRGLEGEQGIHAPEAAAPEVPVRSYPEAEHGNAGDQSRTPARELAGW
ncbi:MAG: hypothetical protein ACYC3Q_04675 [Gemmatimonadaceae bacterium]